MKILVTGGAGFIGSHVVDRLLAEGHQVTVVDDLSSGKMENLNPAAKFYQLDIRSSELKTVFEVEKPSIVNHHAAQIDVRRSIADPIYDARVNVEGTINLLECCRLFGIEKVIFASSGGAVYGEPEYLPVDEDHPVNPKAHYGLTKYVGEKYLNIYRNLYGINYIALRYGNVFGPKQDPYGEAGVIAIFIGRLMNGEAPCIFGTGEQIRDYVYVDDVTDANVAALDATCCGSFNIGTGLGTSVNELFWLLRDYLDSDRAPVYGPPRDGELEKIILDIRKGEKLLGWKPQTTITEGIKKTVCYFKNLKRKEQPKEPVYAD